MGIRLPLTPVVRGLPEMVPFVGPETFERRNGRPLRVRLGANESVFALNLSTIRRQHDEATVNEAKYFTIAIITRLNNGAAINFPAA